MGISEILIPICAALGLIIAFCIAAWVKKAEVGTDKMKEISERIQVGSTKFLIKEYKIFAIVFAVMTIVLGLAIDWVTAALFVVGVVLSALAGYLGTKVTTWGNARTVNAAMTTGMSKAFKIAFRSGAVIGLCVTCFALAGLGLALIILGVDSFVKCIIGFGLGAASMAFFGRICGGVYTKAADIGEGVATKFEGSISDDDLKNPAVIADNAGDNIGNVAGVGFNAFESYICSILAAVLLATIATYNFGEGVISQRTFVIFPIVIATIGVAASIVGILVARCKDGSSPIKALHISEYISAGIVVIASIFLSKHYLKSFDYSIAIIIGIVIIVAIGKITEYYTSNKFKQVRKVAENAQLGTAASIMDGVSVGMMSTLWPVILLAAGTFASFYIAGFYGIALAGVGMLSFSGITVTVNAFGPVSDNADGIAEMIDLSEEANEITNELDFIGNIMSAIGKGFAIAATALTSVALLLAYAEITELTMDSGINLLKPVVIFGLFVGAMLPFILTAVTTNSISRAVRKVVAEIMKQFKDNKDILKGNAAPDYDRCLEVHTEISLKSTIVPGIIAIVLPIAVGFLFGTETLGGMLGGTLVSGIVIALVMVNSGGAWDNAKKYIESGQFGGKTSAAFRSATTSDMVGDSYKDTAGPSISVMIKLMLMVSIACAPLIAEYGGILSSALGY